jgi:sugar O-acyltransferase (sialic acid O-acetyltransferase NeuD family)
MLESKEFVLWGNAGHAKVLASLITLRGGRVVALFDNDPQSRSVLTGVPLFIGEEGFVRWVEVAQNPNELRGLAAIGGAHGRDRLAVQERFRAYGLQIEALVHPSASVCATASLGAGTQVLAQAVVAADALVGEACIINHRAAVDHECVLEDGVHLAPGSTLCGCVKLGTDVMIGAGAIVLPRINIGTGTIVGAGAVVTRDLPAGVIAFGNPARIHRDRRAEE